MDRRLLSTALGSALALAGCHAPRVAGPIPRPGYGPVGMEPIPSLHATVNGGLPRSRTVGRAIPGMEPPPPPARMALATIPVPAPSPAVNLPPPPAGRPAPFAGQVPADARPQMAPAAPQVAQAAPAAPAPAAPEPAPAAPVASLPEPAEAVASFAAPGATSEASPDPEPMLAPGEPAPAAPVASLPEPAEAESSEAAPPAGLAPGGDPSLGPQPDAVPGLDAAPAPAEPELPAATEDPGPSPPSDAPVEATPALPAAPAPPADSAPPADPMPSADPMPLADPLPPADPSLGPEPDAMPLIELPPLPGSPAEEAAPLPPLPGGITGAAGPATSAAEEAAPLPPLPEPGPAPAAEPGIGPRPESAPETGPEPAPAADPSFPEAPALPEAGATPAPLVAPASPPPADPGPDADALPELPPTATPPALAPAPEAAPAPAPAEAPAAAPAPMPGFDPTFPEAPAPGGSPSASLREAPSKVDPQVRTASMGEPPSLKSDVVPPVARPADQVAARVNGEVISLNDLAQATRKFIKENVPSGQQLSPQDKYKVAEIVLNELIDRTLLLQHAKREIKEGSKQMEKFAEFADALWRENELPVLLRKYEVDDEAQLRAKLREEGKSIEDLLKEHRQTQLAQEFARRALKPRIQADLPEMYAYYYANAQDYDRPALITWREVVVEVAKHRDRPAARAQAEALLARIRHGEDIDRVARTASDGPNADTGGLWKTQPGGYGIAAVNQALESLPLRQVSPIIEGPSSFHIVRVEARRKAGPARFDEVQDEIRETLFRKKFEKERTAYTAKLRDDAIIETIDLAAPADAHPRAN